MTSVAQDLQTQLSRLPVDDRAELAYFLIRSLDPDGYSEAWRAEISRRVESVLSGEDTGEDAASVFARLREQYA